MKMFLLIGGFGLGACFSTACIAASQINNGFTFVAFVFLVLLGASCVHVANEG